MYEFTPFKKTDKLSYESFIQFPRELLNREEYKVLSPNAMLLYSILTDRLELSFKQIESNKKIQFYDAKGDMYVIFKREEIQEKMHIKRAALDSAIAQLKECNLIKEHSPKYNTMLKDGKSYPYIKVTVDESTNAGNEKTPSSDAIVVAMLAFLLYSFIFFAIRVIYFDNTNAAMAITVTIATAPHPGAVSIPN